MLTEMIQVIQILISKFQTSFRDRSPHHSLGENKTTEIVPLNECSIDPNNDVIGLLKPDANNFSNLFFDESSASKPNKDVDTSSDSFFHGIEPAVDFMHPQNNSIVANSCQQSNSNKSKSLAVLSNAKPIFPLPITILNEGLREKCLLELSNPHTLLSDITINAFCVSINYIKGNVTFLYFHKSFILI